MNFQFNSIKSRLVLMTLICVLGVATLVVSQHSLSMQLNALSQQKHLLFKLTADLLQLRRHEKDFLLRHNMRYVNQFTDRIAQFNDTLINIAPLYSDYGLDMTNAEELTATIQDYDRLFKEVVYLHRVIGLSKQQGIRGEMNRLITQLESSAASNFTLYQLAQIKAAQSELLLNYDMQATKTVDAALTGLTPEDFSAANAQQDLVKMTELFAQLSDAINKMGATESEGLRSEFRRQAHLVESRLANIEEKLQPVMQQKGERVRLYNLLIALATSVAMIVILVKSFATFHRAFSYFVMFFYQCKREFQHMDPKKLGFAEFKSLAELANEMVEARKDAERQLAEVKRQLQQNQGI